MVEDSEETENCEVDTNPEMTPRIAPGLYCPREGAQPSQNGREEGGDRPA